MFSCPPTTPPGAIVDAIMILSVPVAFQYPDAAALLGLAPLGYLRSLGLKKYHSFSPKEALADIKLTNTEHKSLISNM